MTYIVLNMHMDRSAAWKKLFYSVLLFCKQFDTVCFTL